MKTTVELFNRSATAHSMFGVRCSAFDVVFLLRFAGVIVLLFATLPLFAATNTLTSALQQGLFEEEANRNLDAAIASYQSLAVQFDQDRQVAATAIFRLGECYRKLGRTNDAVVQYQRILREFSDQTTLTTLSRQNLTGLSPAAQPRFQDRLVATITKNPQEAIASNTAEPATKAAELEKEFIMLKSQLELARSETNLPAVARLFGDTNLDSALKSLAGSEEGLRWAKQNQSSTNIAAWKENITAWEESVRADQYNVDKARKSLLDYQELRLRGLASAVQQARAGRAMPDSTIEGAAAMVIDDEEQEIRRIQAMIQNSPDLINAPAFDGKSTPLNLAALKGQLRVAAFLLANGADINFKADDRAPLFFAAASGHRAMVELLLAKGADVNTRDSSGRTPLHLATEKGFQSVAEALLAGKADVNARDKDQETPLHLATRKGHVAMVVFLLAHRAEPDAQNQNGRTPLSIAAQAGHGETLKKLLAAGASPALADNDGRTPLSYAAENGHLDSVKALLAGKANPHAGRGVQPLHLAVHGKNPVIMGLLLDAGANANRVSPINWGINSGFGNTLYGPNSPWANVSPLFLAIAEWNVDAVKLLLQNKADPNGTDPKGLPVILSAMYQPEIVKALLEAGANPNVDDGEGRYPLVMARDPEIIRLLLAHKANPEVRFEGRTPLLLAAFEPSGGSGNAIAEALLQGGANVNAATVDGWTALHIAASRGNRKLVELLLTYKADVNVRNNQGKTPLDLVKEPSSPRPGSPGIQTMPMRPLPPRLPGTSHSSAQTQTIEPADLAGLLRQHGALDNLPDFSRIRITRQGVSQPFDVFSNGPKLTNQFTLLETVMRFYNQKQVLDNRGIYAAPYNVLTFPDFGRIIIHRPGPKPGGKEQEIKVSLLNSSNVLDCAKDVPVEFGDVIEIPERVHALNEMLPDPAQQVKSDLNSARFQERLKAITDRAANPTNPALAAEEIAIQRWSTTNAVFAAMRQREAETKAAAEAATRRWACLQKTVQLVVAGETTTFKVDSWEGGFLKEALAKTEARAALRSSSDLSRVKVTRKTGKAGKPVVLTVDASEKSPHDDLWLQDGDVIEVPEK